jgi:hypothetical protein
MPSHQAGVSERCGGGERRDRGDPVGEEGRRSEGVRAAAGATDDRDAGDAEGVEHLAEVARAVRDPASGQWVGAAVSGPGDGHEAQAAGRRGPSERLEQDAGVR